MNNLNILKNTLSVAIDAKTQLFSGLPLYQFKALFKGLMLADVVDFNSEHGELLQECLSTKRKDSAMKNIVFVCSSLEALIKKLELEQAQLEESEKELDNLAIDSTCVIVTRNDKPELQLQMNDTPKKIGRPKLANSLSGAERSKRAREKRKANKLVTVNTSLSVDSSILYNEMVANGHDINSILVLAHKAFVDLSEGCKRSET